MSIINDALKKAQANVNEQKEKKDDKSSSITPPPVTPPGTKPTTNNNPEKKPKSGKFIYIGIIFCIVAAIVAIVVNKPEVFSSLNIDSIINDVKTQVSSALPKQPAPASKNTPSTPPPAPSAAFTENHISNEVIITGIMNVNGKFVALIHDEVYEVGHTINGMRIDKITENAVVLNNNGQKIIKGIKR